MSGRALLSNSCFSICGLIHSYCTAPFGYMRVSIQLFSSFCMILFPFFVFPSRCVVLPSSVVDISAAATFSAFLFWYGLDKNSNATTVYTYVRMYNLVVYLYFVLWERDGTSLGCAIYVQCTVYTTAVCIVLLLLLPLVMLFLLFYFSFAFNSPSVRFGLVWFGFISSNVCYFYFSLFCTCSCAKLLLLLPLLLLLLFA